MRTDLYRLTAAAALRAMLLPLLLLSAWGGTAAAQDCPYTPAAGSPERKAIMDALRNPVETELKQPVVFVARTFTVCGGWAFLIARPQQSDGRPVDWTVSNYREAAAEDMCEGEVDALLEKDGDDWRVREQVICATDVPWVSWAEQHGAPNKLFPKLPQ